ncbi:hypothetical protein GCM10017567_74010 [Amycolatopsis bullii]|uniref:Uncharacterized protein n=1 Tax=Amycolatopsis bullii TaxID=941987 RepID=A0ABQ3KPD1_9PSEU|nr:hypothetical protein GCM10017567_74010 [Amycolatopsis bullii]
MADEDSVAVTAASALSAACRPGEALAPVADKANTIAAVALM